MKSKLLNLGLLITSLFGFLEWGKGNEMFLFQIEWELLNKLFIDPMSVLHPFTMLPMVGQLLLAWTLTQQTVSKRLTFLGIASIGILLLLMFAIGAMSFNIQILASTIPFLVLAAWTIKHHRAKNSA